MRGFFDHQWKDLHRTAVVCNEVTVCIVNVVVNGVLLALRRVID